MGKPMNDSDDAALREAAWHEAGHAVAAVMRGFDLRSVDIDADWFGVTKSAANDVRPQDPDADLRFRAAVVAMSGRAARRLISSNDDWWHEFEREDRLDATRLVGELGVASATTAAERVVEEHRLAIERLVSRLLRDEPPVHVTGPEGTAIIRGERVVSTTISEGDEAAQQGDEADER